MARGTGKSGGNLAKKRYGERSWGRKADDTEGEIRGVGEERDEGDE